MFVYYAMPTEGGSVKRLLSALFVTGLALWLTSLILGPNMDFVGFWPIVWTSLVIGLLNFLLAPLLNLMTCPIYLLTLGLSRFLVSGLVLVIANNWVGGFTIASYWWAVLAAVILSILTGMLDEVTGRKRRKRD